MKGLPLMIMLLAGVAEEDEGDEEIVGAMLRWTTFVFVFCKEFVFKNDFGEEVVTLALIALDPFTPPPLIIVKVVNL